MPAANGLLIVCVALLALAAILTLIILTPLILWSSKRTRLLITAWLIAAGVLVVLAVVGGAVGMHSSPPPIQPIERQIDITDAEGALTVSGFRLAPPEEGVARLNVRVRNASDEPRYLGVEYYVDAGQVADIFSPGAMSQAMVEEVAPGFSGTVTFDLAMPPLARDSSLVIVLARSSGPDAGGVRLDPESEALYQERFRLTEE